MLGLDEPEAQSENEKNKVEVLPHNFRKFSLQVFYFPGFRNF